MSKSGIHIKASHRGKFTAKAKAHGESVQQYVRAVLAKGSHASTTTKREAVFAANAKHFHHSMKSHPHSRKR